MPRLPRYFATDVPQHVILRGNNRQIIFADAEDREFFKDVLLAALKRYDLALHAYVLMTNHIHLLATPATSASLPKTLQSVGRRYVQHFNSRYRRTGTLWEGRYRATVVEAERYLFECMRYIELNPVRAGMVAYPGEFPWSSYGANAEGKADALMSPHPLYCSLGMEDSERRTAYRQLVAEPLHEQGLAAVRECTNKGWALGGDSFQAEITVSAKRRATPLPKGRPKTVVVDSDPI